MKRPSKTKEKQLSLDDDTSTTIELMINEHNQLIGVYLPIEFFELEQTLQEDLMITINNEVNDHLRQQAH